MAENTHFRGIMDRFGGIIKTLVGIKGKIGGINKD
jgi:hypothetical protein